MTENKKATLKSYLKMDFYRAFRSGSIIIGILGVFLTMIFATMEANVFGVGVLDAYNNVIISMPFMLTLIFCALPYAVCFCEDYEYKYFQLQIIRGKLSSYLISKTAIIILSSMVVMIAGGLLYVLFMRCSTPWVHIDSSDYNSIISESAGQLVEQGHYILYFVLCSAHFSVIAALLSLLAAYISLFIPNKLLLLSVPLVSFYFVDYLIQALFGPNSYRLHSFFVIPYNPFDKMAFFYVFIIFIIGVILLYTLIYYRFKRRMENE